MISTMSSWEVTNVLIQELGFEKSITVIERLQKIDSNESYRSTLANIRRMLGELRITASRGEATASLPIPRPVKRARMKYPRGTVMEWTPKALRILPKRESDTDASELKEQLLIVVDECSVICVRNGHVEHLDMYKTQDSFVQQSTKRMRFDSITISQSEVAAYKHGQRLVNEFGFIVVPEKAQVDHAKRNG